MQTKTCPKCQRTLPLLRFNRPLTTAQAIARGYSGQRKVFVESKWCAKCQPGSRYKARSKAATGKQIKDAAHHGRISKTAAQALLAKMAAAKSFASATARRRVGTAQDVAKWEARLAELRDLHLKVYQHVRHIKRGGGSRLFAQHIEAFIRMGEPLTEEQQQALVAQRIVRGEKLLAQLKQDIGAATLAGRTGDPFDSDTDPAQHARDFLTGF